MGPDGGKMGPVKPHDLFQKTYSDLSRRAGEMRPPTYRLTLSMAKYLVESGNIGVLGTATIICDEETFRYLSGADGTREIEK